MIEQVKYFLWLLAGGTFFTTLTLVSVFKVNTGLSRIFRGFDLDQINVTHTQTSTSSAQGNTISNATSDAAALYKSIILPPSKPDAKKHVIACWMGSSYKPNYVERLETVMATWGPRCDKLFIIRSLSDYGNKSNKSLPHRGDPQWQGEYLYDGNTVFIPSPTESWSSLKTKTFLALKYFGEHQLQNYDWFFKTDDDTYVVMENLRRFLVDYSPDDTHYFGCQQTIGTLYNSGGAGYVMSRESIRRLNKEVFPKIQIGSINTGPEDIWVGQIMQQIGQSSEKTVDKDLRHRFLALQPDNIIYRKLMPKSHYWFPQRAKYPLPDGPACCSPTLITFHMVTPGLMRVIDFFLYHVGPNVAAYYVEHPDAKNPIAKPQSDDSIPKQNSSNSNSSSNTESQLT